MNIRFKQTIFSFFSLIALVGCDKNEIKPLEELIINGSARITVINAVPGSPGLDAFYGDLKLNGNVINSFARFPSVEYSVLPPATYSIRAVVNTPPPVVPPPLVPPLPPNIAFGAVVSTTSAAIASDKFYSLFIVGQPVAGSITSFLVEDKIPQPKTDKAHIRFINAMSDGNNMDLLAGIIPTGSANPTTSTAIFSNVARNIASDFIEIDAAITGTAYQFQLRNNVTGASIGATSNLIAVSGRVYTYFSRGFNTAFTIPGFTPVRTIAAIIPTTASLSLMTNK